VHIESKRSKRFDSEYEIFVSLECENGQVQIPSLIKSMKRQLSYVGFDGELEGSLRFKTGNKLEQSDSVNTEDSFDIANSSVVNSEGVLVRKSNAF
jgi:hypothetical protein